MLHVCIYIWNVTPHYPSMRAYDMGISLLFVPIALIGFGFPDPPVGPLGSLGQWHVAKNRPSVLRLEKGRLLQSAFREGSRHCVCHFFMWALSNTEQNLRKLKKTRWWQLKYFFYVHLYLGKISNLTNIFQRGWNHQPVVNSRTPLITSGSVLPYYPSNFDLSGLSHSVDALWMQFLRCDTGVLIRLKNPWPHKSMCRVMTTTKSGSKSYLRDDKRTYRTNK